MSDRNKNSDHKREGDIMSHLHRRKTDLSDATVEAMMTDQNKDRYHKRIGEDYSKIHHRKTDLSDATVEAIVEKELNRYHNPADVEQITGLGVVIRDLTHDKSSLSETCVRSAGRIDTLEGELIDARTSGEAWRSRCIGAEKQRDDGTIQYEELLNKMRTDPKGYRLKIDQERIAELEEDYEVQAIEIRRLDEEMAKKRERIAELEGEMDKRYARIKELEEIIKQRDEHLTERWQRIAKLECDLHGAKMHSSATLADLNRLDTELDETKEERKKWYDKYMMMKEKRDVLEKEVTHGEAAKRDNKFLRLERDRLKLEKEELKQIR